MPWYRVRWTIDVEANTAANAAAHVEGWMRRGALFRGWRFDVETVAGDVDAAPATCRCRLAPVCRSCLAAGDATSHSGSALVCPDCGQEAV